MIDGAVSVGFIHPGEWAACFGNSLHDLLFFDAFGEQRIVSHPHGKIGNETGAGQLVAGRNQIVRTVLDDSQAEWLFMVDADMGFDKDVVERLVGSAHPTERPIVGGLAFALKSDGSGPHFARRYRATPTLYQMYETEAEVGFVPIFDYPRNALVEVDATGAACVLIHRSALAAIRERFGDRWYDLIELPKGKNGRTTFGEDLSFCLRAKACGLSVCVDTSVKTTHDKGGIFLDEETYDRQQRTLAAGVAGAHCIDVVIPTYGRADRLASVAANAIDNTSNLASVVFVVESDDEASLAAVRAINNPAVELVVNDRERSYAGAINCAAAGCSVPWLFTAADDLRFHPGWDVQALAMAKLTGAKVIGTNDLWNPRVLAGHHSTHSLVDMGYVREAGATVDHQPGKVLHEYRHNFVDDELVQVAMRRGVYAHCHTAAVEHLHPVAGKADMDATYEAGNAHFGEDRLTFEARMAVPS